MSCFEKIYKVCFELHVNNGVYNTKEEKVWWQWECWIYENNEGCANVPRMV